MAKRNNHKAALALAQWALKGFTEASAGQIAKTHETTYRTLRRWRDKLKEDIDLSSKYQQYLHEMTTTGQTYETIDLKHWSVELNETLNAALQKQRELIEKADNLEHLSDVNQAVGTLTEIQFARDVLFTEQGPEED